MLLLVPAALLVLIILGAIAVDSAIVFLGQRELSNLAAAAANDAATAALSDERFYRGTAGTRTGRGEIEVDPAAARRLVQQAVDSRALRSPSNIVVVSADSAGRQICVTLRGDVDYVFAKAIPGVAHSTTVRATAVATAVEGEAGTPVGDSSSC